MPSHKEKRDLISILDLTSDEIVEIFLSAQALKKRKEPRNTLKGKVLGMVFQKPSTRTRISFEVAMYQLGGFAIFLNVQDLQLSRGEAIRDTAKTLSRYVDGIVVRAYKHQDVIELAKESTVPVINGLSDLLHPCQVLADIFTIAEKKGILSRLSSKELSRIEVAFVGDGNNVANSWINGAARLGMKLVISTPPGYEPDKKILGEGMKLAKTTGADIKVLHKPEEAVKKADVIYTDVWVSMGMEKEREKRLKVFKPYQVNGALIGKAKKDVLVMHCLPAHRGEEITDEVLDGPNAIVFDQAENRLHVQKAILEFLLGQSKR
ncbi:MAG: ornithine carbamoyltransferase [Candidatus Aminicenantes bacterium]|nr:ornithine carbamoyltransferase [Candidatus Aminicenantes bacterium]